MDGFNESININNLRSLLHDKYVKMRWFNQSAYDSILSVFIIKYNGFYQDEPKVESLQSLLGDELPRIEVNTGNNQQEDFFAAQNKSTNQQEDFFAAQNRATSQQEDFFAMQNTQSQSQSQSQSQDFFADPQFQAFQNQQQPSQKSVDILSLFDSQRIFYYFYFLSDSTKYLSSSARNAEFFQQ